MTKKVICPCHSVRNSARDINCLQMIVLENMTHTSRGMQVQQESYKILQQVIRDQVASEVDTIETITSLNDKVEHWEHKEAAAARQHTCALELRAQHAIDMLNCMKEEGFPSKDIEVATQNANNACYILNSRQRVRAARLTGDTRHLAPENELQRTDNIVHPTALGKVYTETHPNNRLSPLESHQ